MAALPSLPALSKPAKQLPIELTDRLAKSAHVSGLTIVHIQDIHQNQEAQQGISQTLQALLASGRVEAIALEGAFSPIDLTPFRNYPRQNVIRSVADFFLQEFRISGPIHAALTTPAPLPKIIGVDDQRHYDLNVEAYRTAHQVEASVKKEWEKGVAELAERKRSAFNSALAKFDEQVARYQKAQMPLGDYLGVLFALSPNRPESMVRFQQALALESKLNFPRVESERNTLISLLIRKLTPAASKELLRAGQQFRTGEMSHADFYGRLKGLCESNGIALAQFPTMNDYFRYVLLSRSINTVDLLRDLRKTEEAVYGRLARSPQEKELVRESRQVYLTGKLLEFALTKDEWTEYTFLKRQFPSPDGEGNQNVVPFEQFYREAEIRDRAMAENLIKVVNAQPKSSGKLVVLVTGGFHTSGIDAVLKSKGIHHISYTPKITHVDTAQGTAYLSAFAQEKTPLQKLFDGDKLFLSLPPCSPAERQVGMPSNVLAVEEGASLEPLSAEKQNEIVKGLGVPKDVTLHSEDKGPGQVRMTLHRDGSVIHQSVTVKDGAVVNNQIETVSAALLPHIADLYSDDQLVRDNAAHALGKMGADAAPAIPDLTWVFNHSPEILVRAAAAQALLRISNGRILTQERENILQAYLRSYDLRTRVQEINFRPADAEWIADLFDGTVIVRELLFFIRWAMHVPMRNPRHLRFLLILAGSPNPDLALTGRTALEKLGRKIQPTLRSKAIIEGPEVVNIGFLTSASEAHWALQSEGALRANANFICVSPEDVVVEETNGRKAITAKRGIIQKNGTYMEVVFEQPLTLHYLHMWNSAERPEFVAAGIPVSFLPVADNYLESKSMTTGILRDAGVRVPRSRNISSDEFLSGNIDVRADLQNFLEENKVAEAVVKPDGQSGGNDVRIFAAGSLALAAQAASRVLDSGQELVIEERITPVSFDPEVGAASDWTIGVFISWDENGRPVFAEEQIVKEGPQGSAINIGQGAEKKTLREFLAEKGQSDQYGRVREMVEIITGDAYVAIKDRMERDGVSRGGPAFDFGRSDIILRKNPANGELEPVIIELSGPHAGGYAELDDQLQRRSGDFSASYHITRPYIDTMIRRAREYKNTLGSVVKRVGITGITGSLGVPLADSWNSQGASITGLTRNRYGRGAQRLQDYVGLLEADMFEREKLQQLVDESDVVYHLGAWARVGTKPDLAEILALNVAATALITRLTRAAGKRLVFASSGSVYLLNTNRQDLQVESELKLEPEVEAYVQLAASAFTEFAANDRAFNSIAAVSFARDFLGEHPLPPGVQDEYAVSKLIAERIVVAYENSVTLRIWHSYGPGDETDRRIPTMIRELTDPNLQSQPYEVVPEMIAFTYVDKVVKALAAAANLKVRPGENQIINVTGNVLISTLDVAKIIARLTGSRREIVAVSGRGIPPLNLSNHLASEEFSLPWGDVPLEVGLQNTIEWMESVTPEERDRRLLEILRQLEKYRATLVGEIQAQHQVNHVDELIRLIISLPALAVELVRMYRELSQEWGLLPGNIRLYLVGGRAKGSPVEFKRGHETDIDLMFEVDDPEEGLDGTYMHGVPAADSLKQHFKIFQRVSVGVSRILKRLDLPDRVHILGTGLYGINRDHTPNPVLLAVDEAAASHAPHSFLYNTLILLGFHPTLLVKIAGILWVPIEAALILQGLAMMNSYEAAPWMKALFIAMVFLLDFMIAYGGRARKTVMPIVPFFLLRLAGMVTLYMGAAPYAVSIEQVFDTNAFRWVASIHIIIDVLLIFWSSFIDLGLVSSRLKNDPEAAEFFLDEKILHQERLLLNKVPFRKHHDEKEPLRLKSFGPDSSVRATFDDCQDVLARIRKQIPEVCDRINKAAREKIVDAGTVLLDLEKHISLAAVFTGPELLINELKPSRYRWGMLRASRGRSVLFVPVEAFRSIELREEVNMMAFALVFGVEWLREYNDPRIAKYMNNPYYANRRMRTFEKRWNRLERGFIPPGFWWKNLKKFLVDEASRYRDERLLNGRYQAVLNDSAYNEQLIISVLLRYADPVTGIVNRAAAENQNADLRYSIRKTQKQIEELIGDAAKVGELDVALRMVRWGNYVFGVETGFNPSQNLMNTMRLLARNREYTELVELFQHIRDRKIPMVVGGPSFLTPGHYVEALTTMKNSGWLAGFRYLIQGNRRTLIIPITREEVSNFLTAAHAAQFLEIVKEKDASGKLVPKKDENGDVEIKGEFVSTLTRQAEIVRDPENLRTIIEKLDESLAIFRVIDQRFAEDHLSGSGSYTGAYGEGASRHLTPEELHATPINSDMQQRQLIGEAIKVLEERFSSRYGDVIERLKQYFGRSDTDDPSFTMFQAVCRAHDDYKFAYSNPATIGLFSDIFSHQFLPHLAQLLFHEGFCLVYGEEDDAAHRKLMELERELFGDTFEKLLRAYISSRWWNDPYSVHPAMTVPIYALRRADRSDDPGIGKFTDLGFIYRDRFSKQGVKVIALMPHYAVSNESPYAPLSLYSLNERYIDWAAVPEMRAIPSLRRFLEAPAGKREQVDYDDVDLRERLVSRDLCRRFMRSEARNPSVRGEAFSQFVRENHGWLEPDVEFMAIHEMLQKTSAKWSAEEIDGVKRTQEFADLCEYHRWAQWIARQQLSSAIKMIHQYGGKVIFDMPMFRAKNSVDVKSSPHFFSDVQNASPGIKDQIWGDLAQWNWEELEKDGFQFILSPYRYWLEFGMDGARCDALHFAYPVGQLGNGQEPGDRYVEALAEVFRGYGALPIAEAFENTQSKVEAHGFVTIDGNWVRLSTHDDPERWYPSSRVPLEKTRGDRSVVNFMMSFNEAARRWHNRDISRFVGFTLGDLEGNPETLKRMENGHSLWRYRMPVVPSPIDLGEFVRLITREYPAAKEEGRSIWTLAHSIRGVFEAACDSFVKHKHYVVEIWAASRDWFFEQWGRDTFIAFPGVLLATGRFEEAKNVLLSFARFEKNGLIPNRIPDSSHPSWNEYNTVDAPMWFIQSVKKYVEVTGDWEFAREMLPTIFQVLEGYEHGTGYDFHKHINDNPEENVNRIYMDPNDGLIVSPAQATWMDADPHGTGAITPRNGKVVEINALWYSNLLFLRSILERETEAVYGRDVAEDISHYAQLASRVKQSFNAKFWNEKEQALFDVIEGDWHGAAIRPNQIFAVSHGGDLLSPERQKLVFENVQRNLLTPVGLRTLDPRDSYYRGRYETGRQPYPGEPDWPNHKDFAYHQGTVWPWLMGGYVDALAIVRTREGLSQEKIRKEIQTVLAPLTEVLINTGSIPEVYDGHPREHGYHEPGGTSSQAWSVSEVFRVLTEYGVLPGHDEPAPVEPPTPDETALQQLLTETDSELGLMDYNPEATLLTQKRDVVIHLQTGDNVEHLRRAVERAGASAQSIRFLVSEREKTAVSLLIERAGGTSIPIEFYQDDLLFSGSRMNVSRLSSKLPIALQKNMANLLVVFLRPIEFDMSQVNPQDAVNLAALLVLGSEAARELIITVRDRIALQTRAARLSGEQS